MPPPSYDRCIEADAIRGVALFGICVVNLPFLAHPLAALMQPAATTIDHVAHLVVEFFFQGKFFVLFSFLFGWGFGVQLAAAERHGRAAGPRYLSRIVGLGLMGVAHAVLVFVGDILMLYAALGLVLWTMRDWTPRRLLRTAIVAQAMAVVALMGLAIMIGALAAVPPPEAAGPGYLGGVADAARQRFLDLRTVLPIVLLFNGPSALAAFCAGLAAYRTGFFDRRSAAYAAFQRRLPVLAVVGIAANAIFVLGANELLGAGLGGLFGFAALAIGGPALGAVYLAGIVAATRAGWIPQAIQAAGRMSLTAYVTQGVVAGLVFNGYGLGRYGEMGLAELLVLAALIVVVVHTGCALWLRVQPIGPLEQLLRGFMRLVSAPFERRVPPAPART